MDDTAKNGSCWTRAKDYGKNPLDTKRLRGNVSQAYLLSTIKCKQTLTPGDLKDCTSIASL